MPFEFSCVHCGKHLEQDQVLFDMSKLFRPDKEKTFNYLLFRLTAPELMELFKNGEEVEGHKHRRKISLTLSEILTCMTRPHNMMGVSLDWMTMEKIDYFLRYRKQSYVADPEEAKDNEVEAEEEAGMTKAEREEKKRAKEAKIAAKKEAHQAELKPFVDIVSRQSDDQKSAAETDRLDRLAEDLESLRSSLDKSDETFRTFLELDIQKTGLGDTLVSGWRFYPMDSLGRAGEVKIFEESRLCPECLGGVFEGAGTAQHRTVVFLGSHGTGKTSAILALTHLLRYCNTTNAQAQIWNGIRLHQFLEKRMCSPSKKMRMELEGYGKGVAPAKTDIIRVGASVEMHKAYSSTFKLVDSERTTTFLSLLDAPGEICKEGKKEGEEAGGIDEAMIEKHFQVVLSSDAYVLCFEHPEGRRKREEREQEKRKVAQNGGQETGEKGDHLEPSMEPAEMVCSWAEKIQEKRKAIYADRGIEVGYIPMLLLFTKCPNLEEEDEKKARADHVAKNDFYMYPTERNAIKRENDFAVLLDKFAKSGKLSESFYGLLRCSPYGFQSTSNDDRKILEQAGRQEDYDKVPAPQNVEKLLEWILGVTASVPVDLSSVGFGSDCYLVPPENRELSAYEKYLLCGGSPVVYEGWDSLWSWGKQRPYLPVVKVAAVRSRLFDNMKSFDTNLLRKRNDPTEMKRFWKSKKADNQKAEAKYAAKKKE